MNYMPSKLYHYKHLLNTNPNYNFSYLIFLVRFIVKVMVKIQRVVYSNKESIYGAIIFLKDILLRMLRPSFIHR